MKVNRAERRKIQESQRKLDNEEVSEEEEEEEMTEEEGLAYESSYYLCPRLNYTLFFGLLIRDFGRRLILRLNKKKLNFELLFPFFRLLKSLVKYMMYPR